MPRLALVPALALALGSPLAARVAAEEVAAEPGLASGNAAFACDLLRAVAGTGGNAFLSPHSISTALAMARAGAAGETARQMDATLRLLPDSAAAFRSLVKDLADVRSLPEPGPDGKRALTPTYSLSIANGLFSRTGWAFRDAFRRTVAEDFAAEFRELDFSRPNEARAAINGWVEEKTKQRIRDIVPAGMPPSDTRMVLANAIHFKASWADPFAESATTDGPFTVAPGKDVTAKRMRKTMRLRYGETDTARMVEVPYRGGDTTMVVLLPKAVDGLDAEVRRLDGAVLLAAIGGLASRKVALELPRFTFTSEFDLARALPALGMTDAFSARKADFSGITEKEPLFIGAVLHKAFVAVDEKGTEAAAATVVMMRAGSAPRPEEPTPFVVDRPFLFLVRHAKTGAILFLGRVVDPTAT